MQAGLKEVMRTHFPEYEIISSASAEDLTLLQLRRSGLVIADLAGESEDPRSVCEHYYSLISQYREIHWVLQENLTCLLFMEMPQNGTQPN